MDADSVVVVGTGAAGNLVSPMRPVRHYSISERWGAPRAGTYPARARSKFGDCRLGQVSRAADIPAGIAGGRGKFTAFGLEAENPALLP